MTTNPGSASSPLDQRWLAAATLLFATAAGFSLLLAQPHLWGGPRPGGCGGAADCGAITATRWAYWGPLPVVLPATVFYLTILGGLLALEPLCSRGAHSRERAVWSALLTLGWVALGAALWFAAVQGFVLRKYCPFCLATHACAALGSILLWRMAPPVTRRRAPAAVAAGALTLLIGGQLWLPRGVSSSPPEAAANVRSRVLAPGEISLADGRVRLKAEAYPAMSGSAAPSRVAAVMFDYTCAVCRADHARLTAALGREGSGLAMLFIPLPLDPACNPAIDRLRPEHANACRYARYALAVWKAAPEKFAGYDAWLMAGGAEPPAIAEAHRRAQTMVGADAFERALASTGLDQALRKAGEIYQTLDAGEIPKLLLPHRVWTGSLGSPAQLEGILAPELDARPGKPLAP